MKQAPSSTDNVLYDDQCDVLVIWECTGCGHFVSRAVSQQAKTVSCQECGTEAKS